MAAVAHALDTQALTIDPQVTAHRRTHRVQNILSLVSVLVAEDGVGELLSVTRGAAIIDVQRGPSARRVDLIFKIERRTILPVRPAVNIDDERMFRCGSDPQRLGEKRFNFELVVVARERERLDFGNRFSREELRI